MQTIGGFHRLVLYCDTDASKAWYERLGFEYLRGYGGMLWLRLGEGELMLHPSEEGPGSFAPVIHACVPDVAGLSRRALELGLEPFDHQQPGVGSKQPVGRPWGETEFELRDPDGHVWAFTQPRGGKMAELKTGVNDASVEDFLNGVDNEQRRTDSFKVLGLMQTVTGEEPKMWGDSIVGFGSYTYRYASGREGDWMLTGFSPRKQALTLYIMAGFERYDDLMEELGEYKTGKSCLYVKKLEDIDINVLEELIKASVEHMRKG